MRITQDLARFPAFYERERTQTTIAVTDLGETMIGTERSVERESAVCNTWLNPCRDAAEF